MRNITKALASASALLLSPYPMAAQAAEPEEPQAARFKPEEGPWVVDSGVLLYQEKDRISTVTPVVSLRKDYGDERVLTLKSTFDTLTGASPNGAAPARVPQTFTGASGSSSHSGDDDGKKSGPSITPSNSLPTASFRDNRLSLSADWSQPLSPVFKGGVGGNFSRESDYTSLGANAGLAFDLNDKNTTLSAGASYQRDAIRPIGGTPLPLTDTALTTRQGDQQKSVSEVLLGLSQVLSPKGFYQLSLSKAQSSGYMTDPYKLLTLLDANNQLIAKTTAADTYTYLFESRPDQRTRHAIFNRIKYQFQSSLILDVSHRYTSDTWGVKSNTIDARLRIDFAQKQYYLEPHYRIYRQTKADFYAPYLVQGQVSTYASADARLGAFDAKTIGLKLGWPLGAGQELSLSLERYQQTAAPVASPTTGPLLNQKMQPDLSAYMAYVGYRFNW